MYYDMIIYNQKTHSATSNQGFTFAHVRGRSRAVGVQCWNVHARNPL